VPTRSLDRLRTAPDGSADCPSAQIEIGTFRKNAIARGRCSTFTGKSRKRSGQCLRFDVRARCRRWNLSVL